MKIIKLMQSVPLDYTGIQPFLFEKTNEPMSHIELTEEILASPFPKFSIEIDNGSLTSNASGTDFQIGVVYCHELTVDEYMFIYSISAAGKIYYAETTQDYNKIWSDGKIIKEEGASPVYEEIKGIVHYQLQRLQKGGIGVVNTGHKAKFKDANGRKHTYKSSDVIYVSNTKKMQEEKNHNIKTKGISWKESWAVSAHWRRIQPDSLGVDRENKRTVKGFTWISNYMKGDGAERFKVRKVKVN